MIRTHSKTAEPPRARRLGRLRTAWVLLYAAMLSASTGCYNGDALVDRVRNDALRYRLEEVDLGEYRVTMPRNLDTGETVEVAMHLFGSLARYKQPEVEQMMEKDESLLRYRTVVAVRESTHDDFTDPDFLALRGRLLEAVNGLLPEPAVQSVGFRNIRFMRN